MADKRDYYEVLGVDRSASSEEIKRAYRRLARQFHPDVNPGDPTAEASFKELGGAYEVLCDPQKRASYDRFGHVGMRSGFGMSDFDPFGGFGDLFEAFFGGATRTAQRPKVDLRGADLRYDLEITLEEAAFGVERPIRISRLCPCESCQGSGGKPGAQMITCPQCQGAGQVRHSRDTMFGMQFTSVTTCDRCYGEGMVVSDPCPDCLGRGNERRSEQLKVKIPAGVDNGSRVRLSGEGDAGLRGEASGDLHIVIHVRPHDFFARRGSELICEVPLPFTIAALGGTFTVPTLDGKAQIDIPAGTQSGGTFRIKGKGLPDLERRHRGDQHVVVRVIVPVKLNKKQQELLQEFARLGGDKLGPREKGIFERMKEALRGE